ncbi:BgTH12-01644 [Blumeria graminis f. sp. triticale]|uniref:Bgt-4599 n=3 Tax=Blumeria graminis TaxID=34373 RepID=A0A061HI61_BLUGR|nr:hypothetical protein BGT96224_4599 [Blumeria graminis f. sp. tritici 96224]CAD6501392.1 BgTH12-01644 [Blumeria graminis f. sp. triticale]VDB83883.1 Bgt-4599 [Blumeria graminis f. sp. tritici]
MNAHALLTSQGWRGTGNSLHPTSNAIGLTKPILVAHKTDTLGIGNKHRTSDLWWMNAFDKTLKGLDTSVEGLVVQTITDGGLDAAKKSNGKWVLESSDLYANFVKGESLEGSIEAAQIKSSRKGEKRKRKDAELESKADRRARKAARRLKREQTKMRKDKKKFSLNASQDSDTTISKKHKDTKDKRKAKKAAALKSHE